jgi:uncharacterized protein (DUF983 family)
MKRVVDKPYAAYTLNSTVISGICVKCPKCNQSGLVTADKTDVYFSCINCGYSKMRHRTTFRCQVENQCEQCGRYYRVSIFDQNKQNFSVLNVACPFCGFMMQGKVQKITSCIYTNDIKNGCEPFMGLELWFLTNFKGKPVWALNRAHLAYLIEYLSADLREKPFDPNTMRTQADQLPAFMKSAKNREGIIKCLKRMYSY